MRLPRRLRGRSRLLRRSTLKLEGVRVGIRTLGDLGEDGLFSYVYELL